MPYHLATPHCGNTNNHITTIGEIVNRSKFNFLALEPDSSVTTQLATSIKYYFHAARSGVEMHSITASQLR